MDVKYVKKWKKNMIIGIDFDGTCVTHEYPSVGKDIGAISVLKELVSKGHKLILNTMRGNRYSLYNGDMVLFDTVKTKLSPIAYTLLDDARLWFVKNDIPLYGININPDQKEWTDSTKTYANLYIDDAALGIPLINNNINRPYVDWIEVKKLLIEKGVL